MRIVVLIKQVPDTGADRRLDPSGRLDRAGGEQVPDEIGERALEVALTHRSAERGTEVIVATMGPASAADAVRLALATGADRAVHLCDDRLAGADQLRTARVLAALLRPERPDLVLAGDESGDGAGGVVPAMLAELLHLPLLAGLDTVEVAADRVTGTRVTSAGTLRLSAPLPAVVSVTQQLPEGRFPTLRGVMSARRRPVARPTLSDLGLVDEPVATRVTSVEARAARAAGAAVVDDGTAADRVVELLVARHLI